MSILKERRLEMGLTQMEVAAKPCQECGGLGFKIMSPLEADASAFYNVPCPSCAGKGRA